VYLQVVSAGWSFGIIQPLSKQTPRTSTESSPIHPSDRFLLGGPDSVRGFALNRFANLFAILISQLLINVESFDVFSYCAFRSLGPTAPRVSSPTTPSSDDTLTAGGPTHNVDVIGGDVFGTLGVSISSALPQEWLQAMGARYVHINMDMAMEVKGHHHFLIERARG
jgi:outer membrane protein assembly factor BamA